MRTQVWGGLSLIFGTSRDHREYLNLQSDQHDWDRREATMAYGGNGSSRWRGPLLKRKSRFAVRS